MIARILAVLGALALLGVLVAFTVLTATVRRGFSARAQPSRLEAAVAQRLRAWSLPVAARAARSPIRVTPQLLAGARAHFADHCAQCHGNDGSGRTEMGRNLYPRAPDMRQAPTQRLSDGELFWVIENGVRLTGMPAWGGAGHDPAESWALVAFIRQLPSQTADETRAMERLNPKSPAEWQEEQDEARFLEGGAAPPRRAQHEQHGGHR